MPGLDEQILTWNPWWADPAAIDRDPHIVAAEAAPFTWVSPLLGSLPLEPGAAHTVRGPRQAGKTTLAKQLIRTLLREGESRILYFGFDLHEDPALLYDVIRRAKELHPDPGGPWYLFLDEVTSIGAWQKGVKVAWDQGLTRNDFLMLTGSSAHDVGTGAEQLPGRRGSGADFLHLPMSFRDFCSQVRGIPLPSETTSVEGFLTPEGRRLARQIHLMASDLSRAFEAYLAVGGFPAAIRDHLETSDGLPLPATVRMLWSVVAGDIAGSGRNQTAALKLLEEVGVSLGNPLKWDGAARAMGMASHHSAREYVEFLSESFSLLTVFFWDLSGDSLQPGKQRKVYFMDPVLARIPRLLIAGARTPPDAGMFENAVATGLFRSTTSALTQADPVPGAVAYWRSSNARELDFVVPSATAGRGGRVPIEVKGDGRTAINRARLAIAKAFGSGIVVSRTHLDLEHAVPVIPAAVFLAALPEVQERAALAG
ncbi:MAG: ATP-binding protein [Gemmatimonadota bacterium]